MSEVEAQTETKIGGLKQWKPTGNEAKSNHSQSMQELNSGVLIDIYPA